MRKWIITIVGITIGAFILSGCGSESNTNDSDSDSSTVTIKFNHWYDEETGNWDEVVDAFEEEHPGIKVDSEPLVDNLSANDYLKKLDLMASAGETLDVVMFSNPYDYVKRVDSGLLAPLDSYIEEEGIDVEEVYSGLFSQGKIDGSYYGLPGKKNTYLVALNKDDLDEADLPVPTDWTWDDYKDYAEKLTHEDGNEKHYGSYLHTFNDFYFMLKVLSKSEDNFILNEDGSSNMDDPMIKESLQLRHDLENEDGSSVPYKNTISQDLDFRQQFFSESASMIPMTSIMSSEWGEYEPEFNIAFAPWPKNNEGDDFSFYNAGDVMSIADSSEHKEEAYEFIRWMSTEGMHVQKRSLSAWKEADVKEEIDTVVSNSTKPEMVDKDSLEYVLEVSEDSDQFIPKPYVKKAYSEYEDEVEKYLLDKQNLDTTIENATKRVQKVVEDNKK